VLLCIRAPSAFAGTAEELTLLPTLDSLNRAESPLANSGKWSVLSWASGTGQDTSPGWGPSSAFPAVNGAYWKPNSFSDKWGDAASITMQTSPGNSERYVALWLDMTSPGSVKTGYQLSWTENASLTNYTVKLSKWSSGTQTVLASNAAVAIPTGTAMAISDTGGIVTAWQKASGGSFASLLSANDTTFGSGYAGIEGSGNISRSNGFKAGPLMGATVNGATVLDNLERSEVPLATGKWSKSSWASVIGGTWMGSYRGYGSSGGLAGAWWNPSAFSDSGGSDYVAATVGTGAAASGEYLGMWLDAPSPGSARSGYEARFTGVNGSSSNYKVELSKWVSGTRTVLATKEGFALAVGTTTALTEAGGNLVLWTGTSTMSSVLTASDTTYTSGYTGLEVNGGAGTMYNFRAGSVGVSAPATATTEPATAVKATEATLNAAVNPNGSETTYQFEYGTTTSYGSKVPVTGKSAGAGNSAVAVSETPTGLTKGTTYHFRVVATNGAGAVQGADRTFTTTVPPVVTGEAPSEVKASTATLNAGVNPGGAATTYQFEYGTTTSYGSKVPATAKSAGSGTSAVEVHEPVSGLGFGTTYHFRISATNEAGTSVGEDQVLTTTMAPTAITEAATKLSATEATLNAALNPGGAATTYQFEYGTTTSYGSKAPATAKSAGGGEENIEVSEKITGLASGTTYHYRIVATSEAGTRQGEDKTFQFVAPTAPTTTTEASTAVSANEATLNGAIDPNRGETTYQFEYGTTTSYGTKVSVPGEDLRWEPGAVEVNEEISGLNPSTTYHYRLVATNSAGSTPGADKTFTTAASASGSGGGADPFYGFQFGGTEAHPYMRTPADLEAVRKSGAKYWRIGFDCYDQNWERWNTQVGLAVKRGINIIATIGGRCGKASGALPPATEWGVGSEWDSFIHELIKHYGYWGSSGTPIKVWEFWNEPNRGIAGENGTANGEYYGEMFKWVANELRNAQNEQAIDHGQSKASITVLFGGLLTLAPGSTEVKEEHTYYNKSAREFLTEASKVENLGQVFNGVSSHPYAFRKHGSSEGAEPISGRVEDNISAVRNAITAAFNANKTLWITEIGWPVNPPAPVDETHERVSEELQAALLNHVFDWVEQFKDAKNIKSLLYYNYRDANFHDGWEGYSGLRTEDGPGFHRTFRPAWYAFEEHTGADRWPRKPKIQPNGVKKYAKKAEVKTIFNPYGSPSSDLVKWGKTTSYGNSTGWMGAGFEEGDVDRNVTLTGLEPNQTYHYRVAAINDNAELEESGDLEFTTEPSTKTVLNESVETLNGNPGYVSVKGEVWASEELVDGRYINLNFWKYEGGNWVFKEPSRHPVVHNGIWEEKYWGVGTGLWRVKAVFPPQGNLGESESGFHEFEIKDGYQIVNKALGDKCLDVANQSPDNAVQVWLWECHSSITNGQTFTLVPVETNSYSDHFQIIARNSDKCVDVRNDNQVAGEQLQQWACANPIPSVQVWKRFGGGNGWNFEIQHSHMCMDDWESGFGNGTKVDQWPCNGTGAQGYTLKSVSAPPVTTHVLLNQPEVLHGEPGLVTFGGQLDLSGYPTEWATVNVNLDKKINGSWVFMNEESLQLHANSSGHFETDYYGVGVGEWRARAVFPGNPTLGESASAENGNDAQYRHFTVHKGYHLVNQTSGKCLSVSEGSGGNGAKVIQWDCSGNPQPGDGQLITWYPAVNHWPYFQIRFNEMGGNNAGKCLDVTGVSYAEGTQLQQWECLGESQDNQLWKGEGGEFIHFSVKHSGQCIDDWTSGLGNGNKIDQWPCNGTGAQGWRFLPVG
jgi:phosphodiesterase/alkaline phosphatase D-like protein